ncbi:hypothetical protein AQJ27_23370 [Streptomyces olivochromogenes]|nr:hypothetical protein AQJ27_23370 [Streptomyces olivochromogenes]
MNAAAAVCAAQLPVVGALLWLGTLNDDPYGATYDSSFGLACLLLFAPLLLWVLGQSHAAVHTMPAATLARLTVRRAGGREWGWHLVFIGVLGAVWSVVGAAVGGWSFLAGTLWIVAFGVLPALGVAYVRGRTRTTGRPPRGRRTIWLASALGSTGLSVVVLVAGTVAQSTGLIKEYEPPKLPAGELAGVWRGGHGAVLRLGTGGRAALTKVAAEPGHHEPVTTEFSVCGGTGTWFLDTDGAHDHYSVNGPEERDGVVVTVPGCGDATFWTIGGSEDEPELYVLFGDPDSGDLRRLRRD